MIISDKKEEAYQLVFQDLNDAIDKKKHAVAVFTENSIELLPAYFLLAEAKILMGNLKKAEEFLIAADWNLLKQTSDEGDKNNEDTVDEEDIKSYEASLHKTFALLFFAQTEKRPEALPRALDELTEAILLESQRHGPEDIHMCSSYFLLGQLFLKDQAEIKAKAFFQKIVQILKTFIIEQDLDQEGW